MEVYLKPIISACYVFPILAVIFTIPYILYEYHKYGSILILRTGIVYTFIFYMLTSYFMTVLPLPPRSSVTPDTARALLVPFDAIRRIIATANVTLSQPSTYVNLFKCFDFWQVAFNILLLFPFGVYLRYYFKRPWWQVLIFSFGYSLFFELTQISGLYGIYRYPYRYFEVDDLICNTLGGVLGYVCTPLIVFMLPKRDRLDEAAYKRGQIVSEFRRGVAWIIDMVIIMIPVLAAMLLLWHEHIITRKMVLGLVYNVRYVVILSLYIVIVFTLVTKLTRGRTIGKALVNIRLIDCKDTVLNINKVPHIKMYKLFIRYFIIYAISVPSLLYAYNFYHMAIELEGVKLWAVTAGCVICILITIYMAFDLLLCLFSSTRNMLYDRITGITHRSDIISRQDNTNLTS